MFSDGQRSDPRTQNFDQKFGKNCWNIKRRSKEITKVKIFKNSLGPILPNLISLLTQFFLFCHYDFTVNACVFFIFDKLSSFTSKIAKQRKTMFGRIGLE
jgi:hypothetical protein